MNQPFKPREDGRIQIARTGDFPYVNAAGERKVQHITADAFTEVVANWAQAGARDVLLDIDHESLLPGKRTEAAGWITDLVVEGEELWGKVRWTDLGEQAVNSGRYRYTSAVFDIVKAGPAKGRPVGLASVALTNVPNIAGTEPVSNRKPGDTSAEAGETPALPVSQPPATMNEELKQIAVTLGLPEGASLDDILAALSTLVASKDDACREVAANRKALAESIATTRGITDSTKRDKFVTEFVANRKGVEAVLDTLPVAPAVARRSVTEAQPPKAPETEQAANISADREKLIGVIRKREGVGYQRAWELAATEKPELFR